MKIIFISIMLVYFMAVIERYISNFPQESKETSELMQDELKVRIEDLSIPEEKRRELKIFSRKIENFEKNNELYLRSNIKRELKNRGLTGDEKEVVALSELSKNPEKIPSLVDKLADVIKKNKDKFFKNLNGDFNVRYTLESYKKVGSNVETDNLNVDLYRVEDLNELLSSNNLNEAIVRAGGEYTNILWKTVDVVNNSASYEDFRDYLSDLPREQQVKFLNGLSYLADVALYNTNLLNSYRGGNFMDSVSNLNHAISLHLSPQEIFDNLKEAIQTGQRIPLVTCIQVHTFIAKLAEDLGFKAITSTVNIGVPHRLAVLKDPQTGSMYLISDGHLLKGDTYKDLMVAFSKSLADIYRITTRSYIFDSNNKQIGTYQTDTQKAFVKNIDAYRVNDKNSFIASLLDFPNLRNLHPKNKLKINLGNLSQGIIYQHTNSKGWFAGIDLNRYINNSEGFELRNIGVFFGKGGDNYDIRGKIGWQQVINKLEGGKEDKENVLYASVAATGILEKTYKNIYLKGIGYTDFLITYSLKDNGVPITNAEGNLLVGGKVGYNGGSYNIWGKVIKGWRIESVTSLNPNAEVFRPTIVDTGYTLGIGGNYNVNANTKMGGEIAYSNGDGKVKWNFKAFVKNGGLKGAVSYEHVDWNDNIPIRDEDKIKAEIQYKIKKNVFFNAGVEYTNGEEENKKIYAGITFNF